MPFWKCYFHVVWTTHQREPLISSRVEQIVITTIKRKSETMGCPVLAINTVADHIHAAVSIAPKIAVAEWVRQAKGLSTHEVNAHFPDLPATFRWQTGYGVLTFGAKNLPFVVSYIENQKIHHASQTTESYLERVDD